MAPRLVELRLLKEQIKSKELRLILYSDFQVIFAKVVNSIGKINENHERTLNSISCILCPLENTMIPRSLLLAAVKFLKLVECLMTTNISIKNSPKIEWPSLNCRNKVQKEQMKFNLKCFWLSVRYKMFFYRLRFCSKVNPSAPRLKD
jgi:hypothetical protein